MKKIKVFLGAYTNYTNAQNLNCRALAQHLDKSKFEVYTLELHSGQLPGIISLASVKVFKCYKPVRISRFLGFLWGIWNCDVAYLPKDDLWKFNRFLLKLWNKKSFSTIESIIDEQAEDGLKRIFGTLDNFLSAKSFFTKLYSITKFVKDYNEHNIKMVTDNQILSVGINVDTFTTGVTKKSLTKILMIGNDLIRKGIYDYLEIAGQFPELIFYIAGSGNGKIDVEKVVDQMGLKNVVYKGGVTTAQLVNLLKEVDLHILPSHSEGFGLVTLEAAAAGIPSIVYNDYGAEGWITSGKNGWVLKNTNEIISVVNMLKLNPIMLERASAQAVKLALSFDWKVLIKDWETEIQSLADSTPGILTNKI